MSDHRHDFWAEKGEVLLSKCDRELYHVVARYINVDQDTDDWAGYYKLADDTHTTYQHYTAEDIEYDFEKIGEVVHGKPRQADALLEWYD